MENKPRKAWIAGLLSLLQPGMGQIYNGEFKKACLFYGTSFVVSLGIIPCVYGGFVTFYVTGLLMFAVVYYVSALLDALRSARRQGAHYQLKPYNRPLAYLGIGLLVVVFNSSLASFVKSNFVQAYKVPAASMEPTILIGDHMLVDRTRAARNPKRGDIVIFQFPEDPAKDFVKRVVAVTGDRVEIRNKVLFVNGKQVSEPYAVHNETDMIPADRNPRDNMGSLVVPADSYFTMGDNRDRSYDSRFWGFVTRDKMKGTVKSLYWSWDHKKHSVRWDRIGREVK